MKSLTPHQDFYKCLRVVQLMITLDSNFQSSLHLVLFCLKAKLTFWICHWFQHRMFPFPWFLPKTKTHKRTYLYKIFLKVWGIVEGLYCESDGHSYMVLKFPIFFISSQFFSSLCLSLSVSVSVSVLHSANHCPPTPPIFLCRGIGFPSVLSPKVLGQMDLSAHQGFHWSFDILYTLISR